MAAIPNCKCNNKVSEFTQKTAIVTGGATGIGFASAPLIAERGAEMCIMGHDATRVTEACGLLQADHLAGFPLVADVGNPKQMAAAFKEFDSLGLTLTTLVCSAGIQPYGTVETMSVEHWDEVININLRGAFLAGKHAVPRMRAGGGGAIVHVSSVQGSATQNRVAACSTPKGGLLSLTRTMDHAADNIRVNTVSPGCIDAPMTRFAADQTASPGGEQALIDSCGKAQPIGRVGRSEKVAEVIAPLASDRASFCTITEFRVDGGLLAKLGIILPS